MEEKNENLFENLEDVFVDKEISETSSFDNKRKKTLIYVFVAFLGIILVFCLFSYLTKLKDYNHAKDLLDSKKYEQAKNIFVSLKDFKDSKDMVFEVDYVHANDILSKNEYTRDTEKAVLILGGILDYKDSEQILRSKYDEIKAEITKQINVENSIQKEYNTGYMDDVIKGIKIDDEFEKERDAFLCDYYVHAYKEGFVSYTYESGIKFYCDDQSVLSSGKTGNYYLFTEGLWMQARSYRAGFYTSSELITIKTSMYQLEYSEHTTALSNRVSSGDTYYYKIIDNVIYVKKEKNDKYQKKFTIVRIDKDELKIKEIDGVFKNAKDM